MNSIAILRTEVTIHCRDGDYYKAFLKLIASGYETETISSVWRYLYRQVRSADDPALLQEIRQHMASAGIYSPDVALDDAELALQAQDHARAARLIRASHGDAPTDPAAKSVLFRAVERTDPELALKLIGDDAGLSLDDALTRIDLLRRVDRLNEAMRAVQDASSQYGRQSRLLTRKARVHESLQEWEPALETWQALLNEGLEGDPQASLRVIQLATRLQHGAERDDAVLKLLALRPGALTHADLAEILGDTQLLEAKLLRHCDRRSPEPDADADAARDAELLEALLNTGQIGLAQYLNTRRGPLPGALSDALQDGQKQFGWPSNPASPAIAARISSPACLLPLPAEANLPQAGYRFDPSSDRLLLINSSLNAGGAERQLVMLVEALLQQGLTQSNVHVALFSLVRDRGQAHFLEDLEKLGVQVHDLRHENLVSRKDVRLEPQSALLPAGLRRDVAMLTPLVRRLRPKVVHAWQDRPAISAGWVCAHELVPRLVISTRNMSPVRRPGSPVRIDRTFLKALVDLPNTVMSSNSIAGARDYENWLGLAHGTSRVLPNGVRMGPAPAPKSSDRKAVRIRGVFRFSPAKRPFLWLETVARLRALHDAPIELALYGNGPLEVEIRRHATHLGLKDLAIVTGEKDPRVIYGGGDLTLLMSEVEGTPNVLLEAQAEGLLVAGCDVGGTREAMYAPGSGPGAGSLLFTPDVTAEKAARQLAGWLPGALTQPVEPRRNHVQENYSAEALGRIALSFYQQQPGSP